MMPGQYRDISGPNKKRRQKRERTLNDTVKLPAGLINKIGQNTKDNNEGKEKEKY